MSDIKEKLAFFTCHGVQIGKTYGGLPTLIWEDVAGEMKGLPMHQSELLLAKYADYSCHRVFAFWNDHLLEKKWNIKRFQVTKLARFTLDEALSEPRCGACKGVKELTINEKVEVCDQCGGKGYKSLSNREVAKLLGFAGNSLDQTWQCRLDYARSTLQAWEAEAVASIKQNRERKT